MYRLLLKPCKPICRAFLCLKVKKLRISLADSQLIPTFAT